MSTGERRLAAIMFTDIVGYSFLARKNEALAMSLLEDHNDVLRPILAKHGGREVKTIGDAFLVEFTSALEAVRCAYDLQDTLRKLNSVRKPDEQIVLRIGIHLGDVVHKDGDVYGDAVNVASRIEPLASPGGICLTEHVYEHVKNNFELPFTSLGEKELKNIDEPITIYSVVLPWDALQEAKEEAAPQLDKRRLAVLPLVNISSDPRDEYFADGMTEELISTISRIKGFRVIARTSAMQYKGQNKRISEIGNELKAGTLIEGSVRKSGDLVRISVQLIDSSTEEHLWADDYERKLENVFQIQRDIAAKVADELKVKLPPDEKTRLAKKETGSPEAFSIYLKGRYFWNERSDESLKKAATYFQKAIDIDPAYARAYSGLADTYSMMAFYNMMPAKEGNARAKALAQKALEIDGNLAEAYTSSAFIGDDSYDWKTADAAFNKALELNPSYATAHFWYSLQLLWLGRDEEALEHARQAEELDPLSPAISIAVGQILTYVRRYPEAINHLEEKLKSDPDNGPLHFILGIACLYWGDSSRAAEEERRCMALRGRLDRPLTMFGSALARMGKNAEAREVLSELEKSNAPASLRSIVLVELGEREDAIALVERAYEDGESGLAWISVIPAYDPIATDPRFMRILRKMNLTSRSPAPNP